MRSAVVLALFFGLALTGVLHHEMWRDELEIWLIARDSASLAELATNMSTQGHPALWYFLVFGLTRLTREPLAMQLLHVLIATASAAVFLVYAPFRMLQRILFCFGYFAFYEYTVISRSYGLEFLLVFAFCALFPRRGTVFGWLVLILVLLAHTNLYGTIVAASFGLVLGVDAWPKRRLALSVAGLGVLTAAVHVLAQGRRIGSAHSYAATWDFPWIADSLSAVACGYLPLPDFRGPSFWNTSILAAVPQPLQSWIGLASGLALLAACVVLLARAPLARLAFVCGAGSMLAVILFIWYGQLRQHGQFFLLFVACSWLAAELSARRSRHAFLTVLLAIHAVAGIYAWARDLVLPFSNAAAVAGLLESPELRAATLVGSVDYSVEPITAFIQRPIYYPESRRFGTFMTWGGERRVVPPIAALEASIDFAREGQDVVMILSSKPFEQQIGEVVEVAPGVRMEYIASFTGAIVHEENYFVCRLGSSTE